MSGPKDKGDTRRLAKALVEFENRYLEEMRMIYGQPDSNLEGQDRVLSIVRKICERDGLNFPAPALEVLVSNVTIALTVRNG